MVPGKLLSESHDIATSDAGIGSVLRARCASDGWHVLMADPTKPEPCHRWWPLYAAAIAVVIATGLLLRSHYVSLPWVITKYAGDALWALVVFLLFGLILRRASTLRVSLLALAFAWAIEFSQLYHAGWIDSIHATRIGALVLGASFHWPDLLAYAAGIAVGALAESITWARRPGR